jgi:hypothetical protein
MHLNGQPVGGATAMEADSRRILRRCAHTLLAGIVIAGAWSVLSPEVTRSQACCASTGTGQFGLVGHHQDAIVATQLSYERGFGTHDPQGRFDRLGDASVDDVVLMVGGGFRFLDRRLQIHGSLPLRLQHRRFGEQRDTRVLPGDANLDFRWTAIMGGTRGLGATHRRARLPFLDFFVGTRSPTGRAPESARSPLAADVTGMGSWEIHGGVRLVQFLTKRHALSMTAAYGYQLARDVPDRQDVVDFWPGHSVEVRASWLYIHNMLWSGGLFSAFRHTTTAHLDGQAVPHSSTRRMRVGAYFTHALALPTWETTVIVSSDVPADRVGQGIPFATASVAWIIQRNFQ